MSINMTVNELLIECRVIPVVVIRELTDTESIIGALYDGKIKAAEITFRTECAAQAIRRATIDFPDMYIGAGTVINREQAKQAISAGTAFIVSPGFSEAVADVCAEAGIPYLPGCVTPTEIIRALDYGITTVKFFPASVYGGLDAIKALGEPFTQVKFLPTGGINLLNIKEYLSCEKVAAVGGSFMLKGDIRQNCAELWEALK